MARMAVVHALWALCTPNSDLGYKNGRCADGHIVAGLLQSKQKSQDLPKQRRDCRHQLNAGSILGI